MSNESTGDKIPIQYPRKVNLSLRWIGENFLKNYPEMFTIHQQHKTNTNMMFQNLFQTLSIS